MNNVFKRETIIPLSLCDNTSRLSVTSMFTLFMDIATDHANELKLSSDDLGEGKFWIAVRTKVKIFDRPKLSQKVTLATWPQEPVRVRANRHYTISNDGLVVVCAKSEWTVVDINTSKLQRLNDVYPQGFEFFDKLAVEEPFARMSGGFEDAKEIAQYTINSTDIDLVQHMNNAAYIRALMSIFSCKELEDSPIKEIEIVYKAQSYEGETLTIKEREDDDATLYGMIKPDGIVAAIVRIIR